jgi:tetratricopeptide (TPR) repeat protein
MHPRLFRLRERLVSTRLFSLASHWVGRRGEPPQQALERFVEGQTQEFLEMFAVFSKRVEGADYATPEQMAQRDALYRLNLEEMVRVAQSAGARVVLLTLTQNFADWAPGASTHRADLSESAAAEWQGRFAAGERAAQAGDCRAALADFRRALAIDDQHALLHFRIADCEAALGRFAEARAHYRRASDLDRVPHGAPTSFNDAIRSVAQRSGALLVDVDAALEAESEHGLVGDSLVLEFVHPNLRAHQVIARVLAEALREAGIPRPASEWRQGTWVDPSPESLVAAHPELRARELEAIRFTCAVARRDACVHEQAAALAALAAQGVRAFEPPAGVESAP